MLLTAYFEFGVNNSTIIIGPKRTVKSGVKVSGKERSVVDKVAALTSTNVAWVRVPVVVSVLASLLQEFFSGYGLPSRQKTSKYNLLIGRQSVSKWLETLRGPQIYLYVSPSLSFSK